MTITQYREAIKSLMDKVAEIKTRCAAENGREPTDAEVAHKKQLLADVEGLREKLAVEEWEERMRSDLEKPANGGALTRQAPQSPQPEDRKQDQWSNRGEFAFAVRNASMPGGSMDPRLYRSITGLGETVPSDGGFLVPPQVGQQWMEDLFATGLLWGKVGRRVPITGNSNGTVINGFDETSRASTTAGGVVVYMVGEGNQITASKPKFRQIELKLKKATGLCYATEENLQDAPQMESILRDAFVGGFGFKLDDLLVNGTGSGEPLGILNAGSLVSVAAETGQRAGTILAENVIKMYSRMLAPSLPNAIWLVNQNTLPQLLTMSVAVGTGGVPVYLPPGNTLANAPGGALLGRPVFPIEQCASVGTVGDIIFADLTNGYVVAEKGGLQTDMSIHLRFDYAESVFRFILRIDGQPMRATALTPYKGGASYTQSHFIALATRS